MIIIIPVLKKSGKCFFKGKREKGKGKRAGLWISAREK